MTIGRISAPYIVRRACLLAVPILVAINGCGGGEPVLPAPVDVSKFAHWKTFSAKTPPYHLAFSRDGTHLFGIPDTWDLESGAFTKGKRHGYESWASAYDPENEVYGFVGVLQRHPKRNRLPVLMDLKDPEQKLRTDDDVPKNLTSLTFSQTGGYMAATIEGGGIAIWRVWRSFGEVVVDSGWTCDGNFQEPLVFSPDGAKLACRNTSGDVLVIDRRGSVQQTFPCRDGWRFAFSPDCNLLAVGRGGRLVDVYDLTLQLQSTTINASPGVPRSDIGDSLVGLMVFTPDGQTIVTNGYDNELCFWNVRDGKLIHEIPPPHKDGVSNLTFSSDGRLMAARAYMEGNIHLWRVE